MTNFFNNDEFADSELFSSGGGTIAEGDYLGKIKKAEVKTSKAGDKYVNSQLTLENGASIFDSLNLEHPTSGPFAKKALARIIKGGVANPETVKLTSIEEVARTLTGLPVAVTIKHKGENDQGYMQYNIYYNSAPEKVIVSPSSAY